MEPVIDLYVLDGAAPFNHRLHFARHTSLLARPEDLHSVDFGATVAFVHHDRALQLVGHNAPFRGLHNAMQQSSATTLPGKTMTRR